MTSQTDTLFESFATPPSHPVPPPTAIARWWCDPWLWGIALAASFFLFHQLGQRPFWQDEAETACLAKNVLRFGLPRAYDGVNYISQEQGREYGADFLWSWSPWMQIYVSALGLKIGGIDTFAGRFPFALAGLLCVFLTYRLVRVHFGDVRWARLAALILALSVPWILFARQNRYYTLGALLTLLSLEAFIPRRPSTGAKLLAGVALGLMFHANYLLLFSFGPAIYGAKFLVERRLPRVQDVWLTALAALVIILPGFAIYGIGKQGGMMDFTKIPANIGGYFSDFVQFMLPLPLCAYLLFRWRKFFTSVSSYQGPEDETEKFILVSMLAILASVFILALIPQRFFRYIVHLFPMLAIVFGWMIARLWRKHALSAALLGILLMGTNWLHIIPMEVLGIVNRPWQTDPTMLAYPNFPLRLLAMELLHGYPDVNANIIDYFQKNARKGDTILITYGDLPLQFYTDFKVLGGLRADDPEARNNPEWVVKRCVSRTDRDGFLVQSDDVSLHHLDLQRDYDRLELDFADEMFGNRADPYYHRFVPQEEPYQKLVVHRRKDLRDRP